MSAIKDELASVLDEVGIQLRPDFDEGNSTHIREIMAQLSPYKCDGGPLNSRTRLTRILTLLGNGLGLDDSS